MGKYTRIVPIGIVQALIEPVSSRLAMKFIKPKYRYMASKEKEYLKKFEGFLTQYKVLEQYPQYDKTYHIKKYKHMLYEFGTYPDDYFLMEFYKKSDLSASTYCTTYNEWHDVINPLNSQGDSSMMTDKSKFNKFFAEFITRDWLYIDKNITLEQFARFVKEKDKVIIKPAADTNHGQGVEVVLAKDYNTLEKVNVLYERIKNNNVLVEEFQKQTGVLHDINPLTVNTVRFVTMCINKKAELAFAILKCGNGNTMVDNLSRGGLKMPVDAKTGIVCGFARDNYNNKYMIHPHTGIQLIGLHIPNWENSVKRILEAAEKFPELPYLGWDVCVSDDGISIIEGNNRSSLHDFQFFEFDGYKQKFEKYKKVYEASKKV